MSSWCNNFFSKTVITFFKISILSIMSLSKCGSHPLFCFLLWKITPSHLQCMLSIPGTNLGIWAPCMVYFHSLLILLQSQKARWTQPVACSVLSFTQRQREWSVLGKHSEQRAKELGTRSRSIYSRKQLPYRTLAVNLHNPHLPTLIEIPGANER